METLEKEQALFFEKQKKLVTEENISTIHDAYVTDYNRGVSKVPFLEGMLSIADRQEKKLNKIESSLMERYNGFAPHNIKQLVDAPKEVRIEAVQKWINAGNYSEKEFNEALTVIFRESRRYFKIFVNYQIIKRLITVITHNRYPQKLKLYKDLSEEEKARIRPPENKLRKDLEQLGEEYEPTKKEVRRQACIVIEESGKPLSYFKAASEKYPASSKLYSPVIDHFEQIGNNIPKSTVRKYLDTGIKEGILQKMLENRRKKQD